MSATPCGKKVVLLVMAVGEVSGLCGKNEEGNQHAA
jgi:hypothetical protein